MLCFKTWDTNLDSVTWTDGSPIQVKEVVRDKVRAKGYQWIFFDLILMVLVRHQATEDTNAVLPSSDS